MRLNPQQETPAAPRKLRSGESLWSELAGPSPSYGSLTGDIECEVVVLGAGVTGALIARYLSEAGASVVLVEGLAVARGSTAASTGLLQYEVDTPLVDLIGKVGEAAAVHAYRRGVTAIDAIEALISESNSRCDFARRDSLYFCSQPAHLRDVEREFECRRHFGFDVEWLSRDALRGETSIDAPAAIRSRGDAQIDPLRFTLSLVDAAAALGARVFDHTPLERIEETDSAVVCHTPLGRIRARKIVYATGYQSARYLRRPAGTLHSTYAVASLPELEIPGWPANCLLWESDRPYFYGRRNSDGRALIGGEDTDADDDHDRDALFDRQVSRLIERFQALFPEARFIPEFAWAGTFGETKDGLAYIGQLPDRPSAYFALGYGGNGITFSVIAAQLISDLYRGRPNPDAAVFRFER
jgi:glycine/D-amino acid oxidase-like deaminating enzyme